MRSKIAITALAANWFAWVTWQWLGMPGFGSMGVASLFAAAINKKPAAG